MKLPIILLFPAYHIFLLLRSRYSSQHSVLEHRQSVVFPLNGKISQANQTIGFMYNYTYLKQFCIWSVNLRSSPSYKQIIGLMCSSKAFCRKNIEFLNSLLTRRECGLPAYVGADNFFAELQHLKIILLYEMSM